MKLLLDENLPRRLKNDLTKHDVITVRDRGWNGLKNGELLERMIAENFDALLTFDKNLEHQQNFNTYPVAVLVLIAQSNQYKDIKPLVPAIREALIEPRIGVMPIT